METVSEIYDVWLATTQQLLYLMYQKCSTTVSSLAHCDSPALIFNILCHTFQGVSVQLSKCPGFSALQSCAQDLAFH